MMRKVLMVFLACGSLTGIAALSASGCSNNNKGKNDTDMGTPDDGGNVCSAPFETEPECTGADVAPLKGSRQLVISKLEIGGIGDGFDFNCDGKPDNKLAPLGAIANSAIQESFDTKHDLIVPIELFGYDGSDSACTKASFYIGRFNEDRDRDGKDTTWSYGKGDCDDTNAAVHPGATEILDNLIDDDCDGYADNKTPGSKPSEADSTEGNDYSADNDGDGYSRAQGDCNDTDPNIHPGAAEVCNNGLDEDCSGIADDSEACDPFGDSTMPFHLLAESFSNGDQVTGSTTDASSLSPFIEFPNGSAKNGLIDAGPNLFKLNIAVDSDISLDLALAGAHLKMKTKEDNGGTYVTEGVLGGVLQVGTLAQIHIDAGGILKKEQSLADAIFPDGAPAASILGLDSDKDGHYLPDVDMDGDGLETFWMENTAPNTDGGATLTKIDTCKDGDGTIIHNDFDGKGTPCIFATDDNGKLRFVDGLSAALKFQAVPAKLVDVSKE